MEFQREFLKVCIRKKGKLTLAAFRPWGSSEGAGRVRLTRCKDSQNLFNAKKCSVLRLFIAAIVSLCLEAVEYEGKYVVDPAEFPYLFSSHHQDFHRTASACLVFGHYLAAGSARGGRDRT